MLNKTNTSQPNEISRMTLKRSSIGSYDSINTTKILAKRQLKKGIKHNDLNEIVKGSLSDRKNDVSNSIDVAGIRSRESFSKVRKQHDTLLKQKIDQEKYLQKLKQQLDNVKAEKLLYSNKKSEAQKIVKQLELRLEQRRQMLDETSINAKSYSHVLNRLRLDKVIFNEKKFTLENQLMQMNKQKTMIKKQDKTSIQETQNQLSLREALEKRNKQQSDKMQDHIRCLIQEIAIVQETNQLDQIRQKHYIEIRQLTHQQKGADQKQWKQILLTHRFVGKFLSNMMDSEMKKFQNIETAFRQIKAATRITNAQSIVTNFLNRQKVYGQLLDTIAKKQKTIRQLNLIKSQLQKQANNQCNGPQLLHNKKNIDTLQSTSILIEDQIKTLDVTSQKILKIQLYNTKLSEWMLKQLNKINNKPISSQKQINKYLFNKNNLLQYFNWIQNQLKDIQQSNIQIHEQPLHLITFSAQQMLRVKQNQSQQEQFKQLDQQDVNYLDNERSYRLKENQKFMKELKNKKKQEDKMIRQKMRLTATFLVNKPKEENQKVE